MTKTKANAAWHGLSKEQRETLERWLFEEGMSYRKALERARAELGFAGSIGSIHRFYHRTAADRMLRELVADNTGPNEEETRRAGMRAVGKLFLRQVTENPEGIDDWADLARMLLRSESIGIRRTLEAEKNEIRRAVMALAREKFEFDAAEAVMKKLNNRDVWDAEDLAREKARILAIRTRLYGRPLTQEEIDRAEVPEYP